ncbi:MAG: short-chain dehydrogenase [Rickettsiales bacterium]|jgi:short-subunit dehydrogenase|nr:short-chain dehydrogenase [Rickettsiales bacterium]
MPLSPLSQTIVITGANSGLGKALALQYAKPGTTLCLTGRNPERLEEVANKCQAKGALVIARAGLNVDDAQAMEAWLQEIDAHHPIDLLIANAGISGGTAGGSESASQIRQIFETNVSGVLNTVCPVVPLMQSRKSGQIAIISSLAGYRGLPSSPAYSGSKAAVKVWGEGLRGMLTTHNVGVTVVTPGYIRTPMTDVNNFPMPFLMSVDKAARLIQQRLEKNPARIAFPFPLYAVIWLASLLPPCITDPLFNRLPGKSPLAASEQGSSHV